MSQNDAPPVLDPTRIALSPDICAHLTTLLHQTLACTVELRSHIPPGSWDAQGKDVFLWQTVCAAMTAALDAHTDLVAERLAVRGRVVADMARTTATLARRGRQSGPGTRVEGNAPGLARDA
jgi:hypothetical protein